MKRIILVFGVLFTVIFGLAHTVETQPVSTPTPVGIISIQGGDNTGRVQPFSMNDIINRTGILAWQSARWTGLGQRIGVLDQGFGELINFETENSISVRLSSGTDKDVYNADPITHGTDVIWVIHSIAPAAELYACKYLTFNEYAACIDWMIASGVKIINHSAGVPALPLDGTNQWSREVDRAARSGVLWVNAAGNFASGYISDYFSDNNLNTYHEFRGAGVIESLSVDPIDQTGRIMLSWQGTAQYRADEIDLDLEVIDAEMNVIAQSSNSQSGNIGELPLEIVQINMNQPFGVRVRNADGRGEQVNFVLFIEFTSLQTGISGSSVISPGDSLNALTVGALQGNSNIVAPYSSRGPLATGAIKPDLLAPGEVLLSNGKRFIGSSAAAPIIAGVAALIWEARPSMTREQIFEYLRTIMTQDDTNIPGPDAVYGRGYLYMALPETTAESTYTPSPTDTPTPTSTETPTPTHTSTAVPSETPQPTETSIVIETPTGTISPTETLVATNFPTSDFASETPTVEILTLTPFDPIDDSSGNSVEEISLTNQIVFSADNQLYVMNHDGTNLRRLVPELPNSYSPVWSPDGSKLALVSSITGTGQIYIVNNDGSNLFRLVSDFENTNMSGSAWSPDGRFIAFVVGNYDDQYLYIASLENGESWRLLPEQLRYADSVAWSPDGNQIVFSATLEGNTNSKIYTVKPDGSGIREINTTANAGGFGLRWMSDSRNLISYGVRSIGEIYLLDTLDGNVRQLTAGNNGSDFAPELSDDNQFIVFESLRDNRDYDIYVMNSDGSEIHQLAPSPSYDRLPVWSPDNGKLAFISLRDGGYSIYTVDIDGNNLERLTNSNLGQISEIAWQPNEPLISSNISINEPVNCTIVTDNNTLAIHVGPGVDRAIRGSLPSNSSITAVGQARSADNSLWWQIRLPGVVTEIDRYWIAQEGVETEGNCDQLPFTEASEVTASDNVVLTGTKPIITDISREGTCSNYHFAITWIDPNGDATRIDHLSQFSEYIGSQSVSGGEGVSYSPNFSCNAIVCNYYFRVVDQEGNMSSLKRGQITGC